MRYEDLPDEQRPIAGREDIKDIRREHPRDTDGPVEKAARKYLKARGRRIDIEFESRSRIDAFPYRLAEIFRARKFSRVAGIEIRERAQVDDLLPTYARITLEEPTPEV